MIGMAESRFTVEKNDGCIGRVECIGQGHEALRAVDVRLNGLIGHEGVFRVDSMWLIQAARAIGFK